MGKKRPKKGYKNPQDMEEDASLKKPENGKRYKNTYLIDPETYDSLANEMLRKPPPDRNVFVSINDYSLVDICPSFKYLPDAPTNLLLFCMRLIRNNTFQPIAVLQRYKDEDQSYVIAQCLKAIIQDLASLGLHVLATISPPTVFFYDILRHLVNIPDFYVNTNPIMYCSEPFQEIIHFYDMDSLVGTFQNMFLRSENVCFIAENQLRCAIWEDVHEILAANGINSYHGGSSGKNYNIFSQQFQLSMARAFDKGIKRISRATNILINSVFPFANLREIERNSIEVLTSVYKSLGDLKLALATMRFRDLQKVPTKNSTNPFIAHSIEIAKAEMDTIMETIDKSIKDDQTDKSLATVVKNHLTEDQKNILKNEHGLETNHLNSKTKYEFYTVDLFNESKEKSKDNQMSFENLSISAEDNNNNHPYNRTKVISQATDKNIDLNTAIMDLKTKIADRIRTGQFNKNDLEEILIKIEKEDDDMSPSTRNYLNFLKQGCNNHLKNEIHLKRESHCKRELFSSNKLIEEKDVNANIQNLDLNKTIKTEKPNPQNETDFIKQLDHTYCKKEIESNNNTKDNNVKVKKEIKTELDNISNQITEENEASIDAKDYINLLKQSCNDDAQTEVEFNPNIKIYSEMLESLQDSYIAHHISTDWLSTIQGLPKLKNKLWSRKVREFVPMSLTLIHADYFINFLTRAKLTSPKLTENINLNPPADMAILDCNAAISMMTNYLYLIKKN